MRMFRRLRLLLQRCVLSKQSIVCVLLLLAALSYFRIAEKQSGNTGHQAIDRINRTERLWQLSQIYQLCNTCLSLLHSDQQTLSFATQHPINMTNVLTDGYYADSACNQQFLSRYVTNVSLLQADEVDLSIAFAIHLHKDVCQFERLLRAVYRPHHWYCVHLDRKASSSAHAAVRQIASCFSNVLLASKPLAVQWGTIKQVDAELQCMRDLLTSDKKWRYFINLTGQEFPLKTMWQLVRILKALNGSNSMEATVKHNQEDRRQQLLPFAHKYNITPVKGAVHLVVVRGYVQYVLNDPVAIGMAQHLRAAPYPDESIFATLNHNPVLQVPGGYLGEPETGPQYPYFNRLKHWYPSPCNGYYQRSVCIWGVADLPFMTSSARRELFVNKLIFSYQHFTLDCLEQWYWNMTLTELRNGKSTFNVSYYSDLHMTRNHVPE